MATLLALGAFALEQAIENAVVAAAVTVDVVANSAAAAAEAVGVVAASGGTVIIPGEAAAATSLSSFGAATAEVAGATAEVAGATAEVATTAEVGAEAGEAITSAESLLQELAVSAEAPSAYADLSADVAELETLINEGAYGGSRAVTVVTETADAAVTSVEPIFTIEEGAVAAEEGAAVAEVTEGVTVSDVAAIVESDEAAANTGLADAASLIFAGLDAEFIGEAGYHVLHCKKYWTDEFTGNFSLMDINRACHHEIPHQTPNTPVTPSNITAPKPATGGTLDRQQPQLNADLTTPVSAPVRPVTSVSPVSAPVSVSAPNKPVISVERNELRRRRINNESMQTIDRVLVTNTKYQYPVVATAALLTAGALIAVRS